MPVERYPVKPAEPLATAEVQINKVLTVAAIVVLYICQAITLYTNRGYENLIGPVMAVMMVIITFSDYYYIPFTMLLVTPNAMGTVFMGKLSFYFFIGMLLALRLIVIRFNFTTNIKNVLWLALGSFNCLHLIYFTPDEINTHKVIFMFIFVLWIFFLINEARKDENLLSKVFLSYAVAVTVNGLTSFVSGTATKYADANRMGLIGIGVNDPNIAALHITLAIAIILSTPKFNSWLKVLCLSILALSLATTVSISGFLSATIVILCYFAFEKKSSRNVRFLILLLICALLVVYLFPMFSTVNDGNDGQTLTNYIEYYQDKLYDRFESLTNGDIDTATSGRSYLLGQNVSFFLQQSPINQLFGGVSVNPLDTLVSHNTFADNLLRFGFLGSLVLIILVVVSFIKCFKYTREKSNCTWMLCKICMLCWSLSLSMFDGSPATLWFALVLLF